MKQKKITREELYNLVWTKTLTSLETELGTNTHQIKKVCKKMGVPVPLQGYWSKLKHNKEISRTPLSKDYNGEDYVTFPPKLNVRFSPLNTIIKELESNRDLSLEVPEKLTKPNKYVRQVKGVLSSQDVYEGLKWSSRGYLNINVAPKNVNRALLIMNSVMQLLEQRGHTIKVGDETLVWLYDYDITMRIFEARKKVVTTDWRGYKFVPTGKLKFQYGPSYWRREIMEGTVPLEKQLAKILAAMEHFAAERVEERRKTRAHFKILRDEENRLKAIEERKEQELEKVKELVANSILWEKARAVRKYIDFLRNNTEITQEWVKWAEDKADWFDPSIQIPDNILSDEDRVKV